MSKDDTTALELLSALTKLSEQLSRLEASQKELRTEFREDLRSMGQELRTEFRENLRSMGQELASDFERKSRWVSESIDDLRGDLRKNSVEDAPYRGDRKLRTAPHPMSGTGRSTMYGY